MLSSEMVLNSRFIRVYFNPRNFCSFVDRDLKGLNALHAPCQQITVGGKGRSNQKVNSVSAHWERCLELHNKDSRIISCLFFRDGVLHSFLLINSLNLLLSCSVLLALAFASFSTLLLSGKFDSQQQQQGLILMKSMKFSVSKNAEFWVFVLWASPGSPPTAYVYILWYEACRRIKIELPRERILRWRVLTFSMFNRKSLWSSNGIWLSWRNFLLVQREIISKLHTS